MFGAIAGIVGSVVSNVAGSVLSNLAGSMLNNLVSQFGGSNVFGALSNLALGSLEDALKGAINNAPIPQFLKDAANSVIDGVVGGNQQPTTPDCQCSVNEAYAEAFDNAAQSTTENAVEEAEGKEGVNWLVALAGALAEVQGKFLDAAMKNMDTMKDNAASEGDSSEEASAKRDQFLMAQSEYQANMQMFNMMANASATSLKSIGEGLTALARKQ